MPPGDNLLDTNASAFGGKDRELLVRLDERTRNIISQMLHYENNYVTKSEFEPVKKMVYSVAALVLTAVISAVLGIILIP